MHILLKERQVHNFFIVIIFLYYTRVVFIGERGRISMIYEETYNFMLRNVSSVEFDVCLYSLLKTDWDGNIRASIKEISSKVGTTTKYMKEIVKRFSSHKRGRKVFLRKQDSSGSDLFQFNISKTHSLGFNPTTDRYCKKYRFFYTEDFRKLSINAKRLLLMGSFRMSVTKNEKVSIPLSSILPNSKNEEGIPFTKKRLQDAIQLIRESVLSETVSVALSTNVFTKEEELQFAFKAGTLEDFLENHTEREELRKKLYIGGYQGYFHDDFCMEIEKVGAYIYRSFLREEKENSKKRGVIYGAKEEVLGLARYVYDKSISRLAKALNTNKDNSELTEPKQVSAFFSKIVFDIVLEEVSTYSNQAESLKAMMDVAAATMRHINHEDKEELYEVIQKKKERNEHIAETLTNWSENWVIVRVQNATELSTKEQSKKVITKLKNSVYQKIDDLIAVIKSRGNRIIGLNNNNQIEQIKESMNAYFTKMLESKPIKSAKVANLIHIDEDMLPF